MEDTVAQRLLWVPVQALARTAGREALCQAGQEMPAPAAAAQGPHTAAASLHRD